MADRIVEQTADEVPDIPELVERVVLFALDEGKEKLMQRAELIPFTTLVVKDNLFIETHPGDNPEQCFSEARHTVQGARGAKAYAFCYDGYIEIDDDTKDAIIAEGGLPGEDTAYAVAYLYESGEDGQFVFEPEPAYVGEAPNFMEQLKGVLVDEVSEADGAGVSSCTDACDGECITDNENVIDTNCFADGQTTSV